MGFVPISIDKFLKLHFKGKSNAEEPELRKNLLRALKDHKNGIKCSCGNDIWVIGSAFTGNSCFTCITGDSFPTEDFELDTAIIKSKNHEGCRHIDTMNKPEIHGIFDDDGFEINSDLIKKPSLCITCENDSDSEEDILCNLTRYDQRDEKEFSCFAYKKKHL
ncbi:MAG: hypothetical protein KKA07_16890 [Bacteroidetes bacterium]|nr:hypothetical protein [Bacteroidota bacterium]MBU1720745.1 hypothetical protein [Bacteroidota bacterium]